MTDRDASASSRRDFIKRVSLGAVFATPIVSSFSMSGMSTAGAGQTDSTDSDGSNESIVLPPN